MDLGLSFLAPIAEDQKIQQQALLGPAQLAHTVATTRMLTAESVQMENKAAVDKAVAAKLAESVAGPGTAAINSDGKPASLSGQMLNLAKIFVEAGDPIRAVPLLTQASRAQQQEAEQRIQASKVAQSAATARMKQGELMSNLAAGIQSQEDWDAANKAWEAQTGQPSPFAQMPYNPKFVEMLAQTGLKMKDRAKMEMDQERLDSIQGARDERVRHDQVVESIAQSRLRTYQAKAGADKKVGGKDVGAPSSGETKAAANLLKGMVSDEDMPTASFDVASQARSIRKANPGLSADDALRQAIADKREAGDFQVDVTPPKKIFGVDVPFTGGDKTQKYSINQKPVDITPAMKPSDLVKGKAYRQGGVVGIWNGKSWDRPTAGKTGTAPASRKPAPEPEDDGDEQDEE